MDVEEFKDRLAGKTYSIEIEDEIHGQDTSTPDPDDSWDRASTYTEHSIQGFRAAPESEGKYYDLVVPYSPRAEQAYYLLYAVYSTGDSFGYDEGEGIEYIGFYKESQLDIARENERKIRDHYKENKDGFSVKLEGPEGQKFDQHTPWVGYFETLDEISLVKIERIEE